MKMIRLAAVLILTGITAAACAQQNTFTIQSNGKASGECHYTFDSAKNGYKITSHYLNHISPQFAEADPVTGKAPTTTTEVQGSSSYKLDASYNYAGGNNIPDTIAQTSVSYTLNKQRTQLQVSKMTAGAFTGDPTPPVSLKPGFVLLPDLDVSALQTFLYLATTHPTADNSYYLVLPQKNGTPSGVVVNWTPQTDTTGTLAGKPVTLHHFTFAYTGKSFDVYGDATNTLMEADITGNNTTSYIRTGFALDAAK
jgi:hypothetical protein